MIDYYEKKIVSDLSIQKTQETSTEITYHKEDTETWSKNFNIICPKNSATLPNFRLDSRAPLESELLFIPELPPDFPPSSEEPEVEKGVLKSESSFRSKET